MYRMVRDLKAGKNIEQVVDKYCKCRTPQLRQQLIDSITERLWPMGNRTVFIPGHGPESTFGRERQSNPYVGGT